MEDRRELLLRMLAPAEEKAVGGRGGLLAPLALALEVMFEVEFSTGSRTCPPLCGVAGVVGTNLGDAAPPPTDGKACGAREFLYDQGGSDLAGGVANISPGLANADMTCEPPVGLVGLVVVVITLFVAVVGRVGRPGTANEFFLPNSLLLVRPDLDLSSLMGGGAASSALEPPVMVVVTVAPPM